MKSRASQAWWDSVNVSITPQPAPSWDICGNWIKSHLSSTPGRAFEVGCFPGRYLDLLGGAGYEVNGVDLTPGTGTGIVQWLERRGHQVGSVTESDYFKLTVKPEYDLVISVGFIEHFEDWATVLRRHVQQLRPGGRLIVCAPNFSGSIQHALRRWLDRENLARHNLSAMDPAAWSRELENAGCRVVWSGWYGRFGFYVQQQKRSLLQRAVVRMIERATPTLRRLLRDRFATSPYCGVVAIREGNERQSAAKTRDKTSIAGS